MTFSALAMELSLAFLIWFRAARPYVLWVGLMLHAGILVTINIPIFGELMWVGYLAFLTPPEFDALLEGRQRPPMVRPVEGRDLAEAAARPSPSRSRRRSRRTGRRRSSSGSKPGPASPARTGSTSPPPGSPVELGRVRPTDRPRSRAVGSVPRSASRRSISRAIRRPPAGDPTRPAGLRGRPARSARADVRQVATVGLDPGGQGHRAGPAGEPLEVVDRPRRRGWPLPPRADAEGPAGSRPGRPASAWLSGWARRRACRIRSDSRKVSMASSRRPGCSSRIRPISKSDRPRSRRRSTAIGSSMARASSRSEARRKSSRASGIRSSWRLAEAEIRRKRARSAAAPGSEGAASRRQEAPEGGPAGLVGLSRASSWQRARAR